MYKCTKHKTVTFHIFPAWTHNAYNAWVLYRMLGFHDLSTETQKIKNTEHLPDGCLIWINVQKHFILNKQLHDRLMKCSGQVQLCRKETFVKFTIQAGKSTWPLTKKPGGKIEMLQRFYSLPSTGFTTVNFIQHNSRGKVNILGGDSIVIVRKEVHMDKCLILSGYQNRAVWIYKYKRNVNGKKKKGKLLTVNLLNYCLKATHTSVYYCNCILSFIEVFSTSFNAVQPFED